jgi:predicted Zn-dependent peptidase
MTQEKLDNQRDVVKNERRWRVDNQPYGDWDERMQAMVYPPDHPYHHSVIGSMADLDAATLEDIETFFRTYYAPNNAVLTVCGAFDEERARAWIERYFGEIPAGPAVPPIPGRTALDGPLGRVERQVVEQDISLARVYLGYRAPPFGSDDFYAGAVTATMLATGKASVLYRALLREQRMAQDVAAFAFPIVVGASMFVVMATAAPGVRSTTLEAALLAEIASLEHAGDDDVQRAIHLIEARQLDELPRVDERADQLSMYCSLFDDPGRINTELTRVRAVTAEQARAFAGRWLAAGQAAPLHYVPKGAPR